MSDLLERAVYTFAQSFLAAILAGLADITDLATAKVALIAALAAGLSAIKTAYVQKQAA